MSIDEINIIGKICNQCKVFQSLDSYYNKKNSKSGKVRVCKACFSINRKNNPKLKSQKASSYKKNCEKIKAQQARRRIERGPRTAYNMQYRQENIENIKKKEAEWRKNNPEKIQAKNARLRAIKRNAPVHDLTTAQWREIIIAYDHRCVYCGRKMKRLTQDHITPLSKGGSHTVSNIVPACKSCNSKKGNRNPLASVQPLLLTISPGNTSNRS